MFLMTLGSCGVANYFGEGAETEAQFQDPFRRPHPDSVRPDAKSHRHRQEEPIRRASICKSGMRNIRPADQMWPVEAFSLTRKTSSYVFSACLFERSILRVSKNILTRKYFKVIFLP